MLEVLGSNPKMAKTQKLIPYPTSMKLTFTLKNASYRYPEGNFRFRFYWGRIGNVFWVFVYLWVWVWDLRSPTKGIFRVESGILGVICPTVFIFIGVGWEISVLRLYQFSSFNLGLLNTNEKHCGWKWHFGWNVSFRFHFHCNRIEGGFKKKD